MNIYVVVEGEGEKKIYPHWISYVNPALTRVDRVDRANANNYFLISGQGYPQYLRIIGNAIQDIAQYGQYDRLVVAVDSENQTFGQKFNEIDTFISGRACRVPHRIVVQHFCIEAWALGNKQVFHRNPAHPDLQQCVAHFDVSVNDPELLVPPVNSQFNRAQYAFKYLNLLFRERNTGAIYSKRNPIAIAERHYFDRILNRFQNDNHIQSFDGFRAAFV